MDLFKNRKLLIATKHQKETVLAPLLEQHLGVACFVSDLIDTDTLGTFSGEIPRKEDALMTLRTKCRLAMELTGCDLVVASEGSFGPDPTFVFAAADDELLMLMDAKHDLEFVVRELSLETNFNASAITTEAELMEFAKRASFPSHGLILKPAEDVYQKIFKGISDPDELKSRFSELLTEFGTAYVETDMRAHFNPTRMKIIEKAAEKLIQAIESCCPNCQTPGFVVTEVIAGLPCSWCKAPTKSTKSHLYRCKYCDYTEEQLYPNQKTEEDPTYCDFCNP